MSVNSRVSPPGHLPDPHTSLVTYFISESSEAINILATNRLWSQVSLIVRRDSSGQYTHFNSSDLDVNRLVCYFERESGLALIYGFMRRRPRKHAQACISYKRAMRIGNAARSTRLSSRLVDAGGILQSKDHAISYACNQCALEAAGRYWISRSPPLHRCQRYVTARLLHINGNWSSQTQKI